MTIPLLYLFSFLFQKAAVNIRLRAFIVNLDPVSALTFLEEREAVGVVVSYLLINRAVFADCDGSNRFAEHIACAFPYGRCLFRIRFAGRCNLHIAFGQHL